MSREYTKRIPLLVVGGGIGGLAAALAVAGAGRAVHVIEKSPEFGEIGEPRARAASDKDTVRLFIGRPARRHPSRRPGGRNCRGDRRSRQRHRRN
jgi:cation diffusion facilitator CzcD-associated flavoprotein CzcO